MSAQESQTAPALDGIRINGGVPSKIPFITKLTLPGKQWHGKRGAFRPTAGLTSYAKRMEDKKAKGSMKAKEKEMKDEKEAERQVRISC
jgi:rRNA-processing protein CGR1